MNREPIVSTTGSFMVQSTDGIAQTLMSRDYKDPQIVLELMPKELVDHQQDMIQHEDGVARQLCAGTHGSSPHLTKTLCGIDFYNMATTGDVTKTINSAGYDSDHVPCVLE